MKRVVKRLYWLISLFTQATLIFSCVSYIFFSTKLSKIYLIRKNIKSKSLKRNKDKNLANLFSRWPNTIYLIPDQNYHLIYLIFLINGLASKGFRKKKLKSFINSIIIIMTLMNKIQNNSIKIFLLLNTRIKRRF